MKTSIVILSYNHWALTHNLLFDIYKNCKDVDEVLVVDNGSTDGEVHDGLWWWVSNKMLPLKVEEIKDNVGFIKGFNLGIQKASGDVIVIVSNDVRIGTDIIKPILFNLNENPKSLIGGKLYSESTGWNKFESKIFKYLEGWLLATTKENWKELGGGFDLRFIPNDYEDISLSTLALSLGYKLIPLNLTSVVHLGGKTLGYGAEREDITQRNREKFRKLWVDKS